VNQILFVTVYVSDQVRALSFYERIGFEKSSDRPMGDGDRWLTVTPPGAQTASATLQRSTTSGARTASRSQKRPRRRCGEFKQS
jgi:hypothetical protein